MCDFILQRCIFAAIGSVHLYIGWTVLDLLLLITCIVPSCVICFAVFILQALC